MEVNGANVWQIKKQKSEACNSMKTPTLALLLKPGISFTAVSWVLDITLSWQQSRND